MIKNKLMIVAFSVLTFIGSGFIFNAFKANYLANAKPSLNNSDLSDKKIKSESLNQETESIHEKINFLSDEQMKLNFRNNKKYFISSVKHCKLKNGVKGSINRMGLDSFFRICTNDLSYLNKINVRQIGISEDFTKVAFISHTYKGGYVGILIEEKGYIFSDNPTRLNSIKKGSLDQFSGKSLVRSTIGEIWKYKEIEPKWYLYYRQHYQSPS